MPAPFLIRQGTRISKGGPSAPQGNVNLPVGVGDRALIYGNDPSVFRVDNQPGGAERSDTIFEPGHLVMVGKLYDP